MIYRDISKDQLVKLVTQEICRQLQQSRMVPVGISVRHVHLCREHVTALFGTGYELRKRNLLSQPGQFACEETVELVGERGCIERVRVLGPERAETQVEVSASDARTLGAEAMVRASGDTQGSPGLTLKGPRGEVTLDYGVIVAERHIHMTPKDAAGFQVKDGECVSVKVEGIKGAVLHQVRIRVSDAYALDCHLDTDDGNACMIQQGQYIKIMELKGRGESL